METGRKQETWWNVACWLSSRLPSSYLSYFVWTHIPSYSSSPSELGHATSISNQENTHRDIPKGQSNPSNSMIKVSSFQLCLVTTKMSHHIYHYDNHIVGTRCLWWGRLSSPLEDIQKVSHYIEFRPTESLAKRWTLVLNWKAFFQHWQYSESRSFEGIFYKKIWIYLINVGWRKY